MNASVEATRVLSGAVNPGATTLTVSETMAKVPSFAPGSLLVLDPKSVNAELLKVQAVSGKNLTLNRPLEYGHAAATRLFAVMPGLIPWTWWGAKGTGSSADASNNTLGFNRLSQQIYEAGVVGAAGGIFIPSGTYFVDNELWIETGQTLAGVSPDVSLIRAASSFPFTTDGEVAILHGKRSGAPVLYGAPGPSSRWFLRDFYIGGESVPNSNGVLISPQQPESIVNVRVDRCLGLYGLCLVDVQDTKLFNVEFIGNTCGLRYRGAILVRCYGLNIEQTKGTSSFISEGMPEGNQSFANSFAGVHLECDQETVGFDFRGGSTAIGISDFFYSNPQTGTALRFDTPFANPGSAARYYLSNIWCNAPSQTFKIVDDVQRNRSLSSWSTETDRWIDWLTPERLLNWSGPTP